MASQSTIVSSEQVLVSFIVHNMTPNLYVSCSTVKKNTECLRRTDPIMVAIQQYYTTHSNNGELRRLMDDFVENFSYDCKDPQNSKRFANMAFAKIFGNGNEITWTNILRYIAVVNELARENIASFDSGSLLETICWALNALDELNINEFILSSGGWQSIINRAPSPPRAAVHSSRAGPVSSRMETSPASPRRMIPDTTSTSPQPSSSSQRSPHMSPTRGAASQQYQVPVSSPPAYGFPPQPQTPFPSSAARAASPQRSPMQSPPYRVPFSPRQSPPRSAPMPGSSRDAQPSRNGASSSAGASGASNYPSPRAYNPPPPAERRGMAQPQPSCSGANKAPALNLFSGSPAQRDDLQEYDVAFRDPREMDNQRQSPRSRSPSPRPGPSSRDQY